MLIRSEDIVERAAYMAEMDFSGEHTAPSFEVNHAPPVDDVTNSSDANRQRGG